MTIRGEQEADYFILICDACGSRTENEYEGMVNNAQRGRIPSYVQPLHIPALP
jgi:hypothetical protein